MKSFLSTRVGRHFLKMFIIVALLMMAVAWLLLQNAMSALKEQTSMTLRAASNGAEAQLREFLQHLKDQTLAASIDDRVRTALESPAEADGESIAAVLVSLRVSIPEAQEILVLTADGRVAASTHPANAGSDQSAAEYFLAGQESFYSGDVTRSSDGEITWVMSAPIRNAGAGRILGVLAVRLNPQILSDVTTGRRILSQGADTQAFRMGPTGETFIVNQDRLMITESKYIPDAILNVKVDTLPVRTAIEKRQEMTGDYTDYRGILVSGASVILRHRGWVMSTEIDFNQAFTPIRHLRNMLLGVTSALVVTGLIFAGIWARGIVQPLGMIGEADTAFDAGDESGGMASEENLPPNEIGEFVRRRNNRVKALVARQRELVLEQKRSAAAAAELERISYSVVHDMRAPLRAIVSFGDLLEAEAAENFSEEAHVYLNRMRGAATRMDRLISDMISYSALLRDELPLQRIDIGTLVEAVIETYPALQAHKHEIQIAAELPSVRGNEAALTQCFSCLLDNALKFTKHGQRPKVQIRAERNKETARIFVEDEGIGITRAMQTRLFGIFQRGSNDQGGTGIGLAMLRIAAIRMGGQVGVISEEGKGSSFWIELKLEE